MNDKNGGEKKKKRFDLFSLMYNRNGKGVKKSDVITKYNLKNYFKLFGRRFKNIVTVNFFYIAGNFPIIFLIFALSGNFSDKTVTPTSELYSVFYGLSTAGGNAAPLIPFAGIHALTTAFFADTVVTKIFYALSLLVLVTFGLVNTANAYITRNIVKCEPIFWGSDFFGTIKRNWKVALPMGILDAVLLMGCSYSIYSYWLNYERYYILFFCAIAMFIVYNFMRFYMYMIAVTFEMGFFKMLKNSFILAILCLGKNFLALIGIAVIIFITLLLAMYYTPLGVIMALILLFGGSAFTAAYVAYPNMKKYMIDPFYNNGSSDEDERPTGKGKPGGYGADDGEYFDAGEYVTDEDEFKRRKTQK